MTDDRKPLTQADALALAAIIQGAHNGVRVARVTDQVGNEVLHGTARHIVVDVDRANLPGDDDDVRDCYLRVTDTFDYFWPIAELVQEYKAGTFIVSVRD